MVLRRIATSSWPAVVATAAVVTILLVRHDVRLLAVLAFLGYLLVAVSLPGTFLWRALLRRWHTEPAFAGSLPTWFSDVTLGTVFGFTVQLPVYLLGVWAGLPLLFWALPVAVAVLSVATARGREVWRLPTRRLDPRVSWSLGAVVVYPVVWLAYNMFARQPLTWPRNRTPATDESFHQALLGELMHRFPPDVPYVSGVSLDYHWFTHAQLAATVWGTGIDSRVLLREVFPVTLVTLTVLGLAAVTLRLSGSRVAAVVAPALLVAGGFDLLGPHYGDARFSAAYMMSRIVTSPTATYGVMILLPVLVLVLELLRPGSRTGPGLWVATGAALLGLTGAKSTFMPIVLCASLGLWLLLLVLDRRLLRRASALLALSVAGTLFSVLVLLGGRSGSLFLVPGRSVLAALGSQGIQPTALTVTAMTATLLVGWLLYGAGAVGLVRRWRDPRVIWTVIAIAAGITVPFVLFRSGGSQYWFERAVAPLVVVLSAWGLAQLWPARWTWRRTAALGGTAALAGAAAFAVSAYRESEKVHVHRATPAGLVYTVLVPALVVACFLAVRWVMRVWTGRARPEPILLLAILLGLGTTNVYALAYDNGSGRPPPQNRHPPALFATGGYTAARFVRDNSAPDEVVATNVHCARPASRRCDNRSFWVSAYTRRRIVIEGWGYTGQTNAQAKLGKAVRFLPSPFGRRLRINDRVFSHPSVASVLRLARTFDADWLFVDKRYPADLAGLRSLPRLLTERFQNDHFVVFSVARGQHDEQSATSKPRPTPLRLTRTGGDGSAG